MISIDVLTQDFFETYIPDRSTVPQLDAEGHACLKYLLTKKGYLPAINGVNLFCRETNTFDVFGYTPLVDNKPFFYINLPTANEGQGFLNAYFGQVKQYDSEPENFAGAGVLTGAVTWFGLSVGGILLTPAAFFAAYVGLPVAGMLTGYLTGKRRQRMSQKKEIDRVMELRKPFEPKIRSGAEAIRLALL